MEEFSEHVQVALKQLIAKSGINNYEVKLSPASKKGDNYLGTLYRVEIISTDNDNGTKLNLICKIPSSDWGSEDNWQKIHIPYEREVYVYNVILKSFEKLQNDKNLNENQKFASYALCHVASDVNKKEFLILEDLHARNFVMFDKRKKMDFSHITLVAKGLAKYHALSFVMRDQQPEKFHKITQIDSAMYDMTGREAFYDLCDFGLKQALEAIDDGGITEFYANVKKIKDNCEQYMESCFNATGSENYRVLSHGDCWNNNMMFKYQDGKPVEICFIDWQIARFVSPVLDLLYFFYLSTDEDMLNNKYDLFLNVYYTELKNFVQLLGSDLNKLYPHEIFQNDLKKFGHFGVVLCSFALNFIFANTETAPDFQEMTNAFDGNGSLQKCLEFKDLATKKRFQKIIRDVIQHAAKRNYI